MILSAIEFDHVWYRYSSHQDYALKDVTVTIGKGEIVGVVGPNGAGKTTFAKHINGLLKPDKGLVKVLGRDTKDESVARLSRDVGIIFQNPHHQLFSETVSEEVLFGLKNFDVENPGLVAERVLEDFGLLQYREKPPLSLSGGEKKRLCIASAIAWDPKILVLDEPTVGQDLNNKRQLLDLIVSWSQRGKTAILVSHDMEFLWALNPRILVFSKGRILADGKVDVVFTDEEILHEASLRLPQLAELAAKLGWKNPPKTPSEAAERILEVKGWPM